MINGFDDIDYLQNIKEVEFADTSLLKKNQTVNLLCSMN
jgi:hypothetical protein